MFALGRPAGAAELRWETVMFRSWCRASGPAVTVECMPPDDELTFTDDVFGKRYGEVLLVESTPSGPVATVFNTFPLNDCPDELWRRLDPRAIAADRGAVAALLNGPRYWLMSSIGKRDRNTSERACFGGLEMYRQATVELTSMNPAPYQPNRVDRKAVFIFGTDHQVYELVDPDGRCWIMQTYSQTVDPALTLDDLPRLSARLSLPAGWTYRARTPAAPVRVDTAEAMASVLQDDLANSYSLLA